MMSLTAKRNFYASAQTPKGSILETCTSAKGCVGVDSEPNLEGTAIRF